MSEANAIIATDMFYAHWAGHRRLTRRVIEAFPEDKLFTFTAAPPMRAFGEIMNEVVGMVAPTLTGLATGKWEGDFTPLKGPERPADKATLLAAWDATTAVIEEIGPRIAPGRYAQVESAFGLPAQPNIDLIWYLLDNEIHHRAQGYVYLRALGIEPPAFYER